MPKRKSKINISTASLRSASSSRRAARRNHSSNISFSQSKTNLTSITTTTSSLTTTKPNQYQPKVFICKGCNVSFKNYPTPSIFINRHVKSNDKCPKHYPQCHCGKIFYDETNLRSHQSRTNKNSDCYKSYLAKKTNSKYTSSEVKIQPIDNTAKFENQIPTYLQPIVDSEKTLMLSKKTFDYNQFHSTKNFQNINIHNSKFVVPKKFAGHAVTDPFALMNKMNVNRNGIYNNATNSNRNSIISQRNNLIQSEKEIQVIDIPDHLSHDNYQLSNNSLSEISSSSSESSNNSETTRNLFSTNIIKKIDCDDSVDDNSHDEEQFLNEIECNSNTSMNEEMVGKDKINHCERVVEMLKQETIEIRDENHFVYMNNLQTEEISNSVCDVDYKDCLELVTILMRHKIPLNGVYNDLMEWKNKNNKSSSKISLESLFKKAEGRVYGSSLGIKMKPTQTNIICPSGRRVSVTSFDADALIYDMLSDYQLMQHNNLIFVDGDDTNPFKVKESSVYGDFQTSEFYQETLKMRNIDQNNDVLVPIQLYMDETVLDSYSKLSLHPLVMTLLIFNQNTRNLEMSWRTLGYIPNFESNFGKKNYSIESKNNDFHFVLRFLLSGIEKILSSSVYYNWNFQFQKFQGKVYTRKIHFVIGNVLGDAKGANLLCSRFGNNTSTTHVARDCDVLTENCDDPHHRCTFHKQKNLQQMTIDELKQICFRRPYPYNAFCNLDFGANIYGINGACAADPCHMFNKGVVERLPKIFMSRLPPKLVSVLDRHVGALITNYGNQSDRNYPQLKIFATGVSSSAKLRSDQHIARVFVIYLVLLTTSFEHEIIHKKGRKDNENEVRTRITLEEYNQWIHIFEETLILHSWVYLKDHPKAAFKGGRNSIVCQRLRQYMDTYKMYAHRKEGMGLKFLKFHQILHLWWIIRLFGSLYNVDTARCESHHKKKKNIGNNTQRRIHVFDEQTSNQEFKHDLLIKAIENANIPLPKQFEKITSKFDVESNMVTRKSNSNTCNGSHFKLTFDYDERKVSANWLSSKMSNKRPFFPHHILDALFKKFDGYNHGHVGQRIKSINGFTEYYINQQDDSNIESNLIRACPNYRNDGDWYDWATVNWKEEGLLECQCLLFIDFSTITMESYQVKQYHDEGLNYPHEILARSAAVLVHSIKHEENTCHKRTCLRRSLPTTSGENRKTQAIQYVCNKLSRFCEMEECFQIVDVDNIHSNAFVIPYEYHKDDQSYMLGCSKSVIIVSKMTNWHFHFVDYNNTQLMLSASRRVDNNISMNDEKFPFEG